MNLETIIQAILALGTIIGGGVAAYATYRSTNSSVKVQEKQLNLESARVQKELGSFGVEEAERISNISLSNLQFMQQLVNECGSERAILRTENNRLTLDVTQRQVRIMHKVGMLKEILIKMEKFELDESSPCYLTLIEVKNIISQIVTIMEEELSQ
jgi:hypothetical protein